MGEIASSFVSIVPSAKGFGGKLSSQIGGDVDRAGHDSGKRLGGGLLAGAGRFVAPLAGLFAAKFGVDFAKDAIGQASDLNESGSKIGIVFGKSGDAVMAASKKSAAGMGISQNGYLAANGELGNLLVSLDIAPKKAAAMSMDMVKLAGDMASFNNASPEETLAAIQSGLTGETEPLKKFGVNMNDATLHSQALKMGLIKTTKEALTPQNKALAAQALIMEQTKTAHGDFARTSGGLANQQRILAARTEDLKTKIGGFLLPVVTKFVTFLNTSMSPAFTKLTRFVQPAIDIIKGLFNLFVGGDFTSGLGKALGVEEDSKIIGTLFTIRDTFLSAFGQVKTFIMTQVAPAIRLVIPALLSLGQSIVANIIPVVGNLVTLFVSRVIPAILAVYGYILTNLVPIFVQVYTIIATQVVPIIGSLAMWFTGVLVPAVMNVVTTVAKSLKPVLDALFTALRTQVIPVVAIIIAKFREWQPTIQSVIGVVVSVIGWMLKFAAAILGSVLPPIISFAGFLLRNLVPAVLNVIGVVGTIIGKVVGFGVALFNAGATVVRFVADVVGAIMGVQAKVVGVLAGAGTWLFDAGKKIISGLVDGIKSLANGPVDAVKGIVGKIADFLPGSPVKEGPLRVLNRGYAGGQIVNMLTGGIDAQRASLEASMSALVSVPRPGTLDFATSAQRASAVGAAGAGGGNADLLAEVQGLRADIQRLPRDYQMGQRQFV